MYRKIEDFMNVYEDLSKGTLKLFNFLTDENMNTSIAEGHRSLSDLAWHIITTVPEMMNRTGLAISTINHQSLPPKTAKELVSAYSTVSNEIKEAIKSHWNDSSLLEKDDMYGQNWMRGFTLTALIHHEIHHRAQMLVLLRQSGQKVPGLFGPAKEEWAQYGMEPSAH